jgi:DNA-binding NtrC family response regulator
LRLRYSYGKSFAALVTIGFTSARRLSDETSHLKIKEESVFTRDIHKIKMVAYELEPALATQIGQAVSDSVPVRAAASVSKCVDLVRRLPADIVLCGADPDKYRPLLLALKNSGLNIPVLVVSRMPEVTEWLDALEEGAADYCGAPFEQQQIRLLIGSVLRSTRRAAA